MWSNANGCGPCGLPAAAEVLAHAAAQAVVKQEVVKRLIASRPRLPRQPPLSLSPASRLEEGRHL